MPRAEQSPPLRNPQLADALQTGDIAAIAFALRHGPTVVPVDGAEDPAEVWTYRDTDADVIALLLFSDAEYRPGGLPDDVVLLQPDVLRAYLTAHAADVTTVFLDVAGPHPMQATPADLIAALDA